MPELPLLRRGRRQAITASTSEDHQEEELAIPAHFRCPISLDLMRDPVTAPTGITYDRENLEGWLARGHGTCPVTGRGPLRLADLVPNHATRRMIQAWCVANRARGVERVPTPKVPVAEADAAQVLEDLSAAARRGDAAACGEIAARARALGKESDRNRRCLASAGAARKLSSAFGRLAAAGGEPVEGGALGKVLAALTVFFPLDDESRRCIVASSLTTLVSVLSHGDLAARASAAIVLREVASSAADRATVEAISRAPGMCDALVGLVRNPVSPQATKAALVTAYYLASDRAAASRFAELGVVSVLAELLVDADKGTSEKALAALDGVLCADAGLESARAHALVVPVLVKKMFRVSDMATEFAVSALWRLCHAGADAGACRVEALRVGAFQKLLLLLQVGCGGPTKERASELLKLLNGSRASVECIEAVDFKGLKRPF